MYVVYFDVPWLLSPVGRAAGECPDLDVDTDWLFL
jgi:hypothetical protein